MELKLKKMMRPYSVTDNSKYRSNGLCLVLCDFTDAVPQPDLRSHTFYFLMTSVCNSSGK
jgi:hypothetical protein